MNPITTGPITHQALYAYWLSESDSSRRQGIANVYNEHTKNMGRARSTDGHIIRSLSYNVAVTETLDPTTKLHASLLHPAVSRDFIIGMAS
jgi:hypothetical protein